MGRPLSFRRHEQPLALALAGTLLVVASVVPIALLLAREWSASPTGLGHFVGAGALELLLRSVLLSALVTALALAVGVPAGFLVGRTDVRGARLAGLLHAFPMFLPPFLLALGWHGVWGVAGIAGSEASSRAFFGPLGLVLVSTLAFTPVVSALVAIGLRSVDPSLEEAARATARPGRVLRHILLPAAAPALVLSALLVFTLSFSELGVPLFLRVDTYPAAVFARLGGIDFAPGEALGLVLPLLPIAVLLMALERRYVGARSYEVLGLRARVHEPFPLGRWRAAASAGLWVLAVLSAAPIAALAGRALAGGGMERVGPWLADAPWVSLLSSAAAATVIVGIGLVVGHAAARRYRGAAVLDAASVLAFMAPAGLLGIGLMAFWNRPGLRLVYGSSAMLVAGFVARYAVVGVRTIGVLVAQTPPSMEEAAAAAGAGFWRRLVRILVPLHARGLAFAWLLALVFCLRDLELSVLYYPPGIQPLTVRIFTLEANGPGPVVAGLATAHVVLTAAAVSAGAFLLRARP
jgi:iron(III) transport system permease protein